MHPSLEQTWCAPCCSSFLFDALPASARLQPDLMLQACPHSSQLPVSCAQRDPVCGYLLVVAQVELACTADPPKCVTMLAVYD
jgi:hypothetical protein